MAGLRAEGKVWESKRERRQWTSGLSGRRVEKGRLDEEPWRVLLQIQRARTERLWRKPTDFMASLVRSLKCGVLPAEVTQEGALGDEKAAKRRVSTQELRAVFWSAVERGRGLDLIGKARQRIYWSQMFLDASCKRVSMISIAVARGRLGSAVRTQLMLRIEERTTRRSDAL